MSHQIGRPGRWRYRFLRWTLPIGSVLLGLFLLWMTVGLVTGQGTFGNGWAQAAIPLATSLVLIVSGYHYRRALDP